MAGSSVVGVLKILLTAETDGLKSGLGDATRLTKQFSGQMSGVATQVGGLGKMMTGLFAGIGITAISTAISKVTNYASSITDLADQTGLSTDAIQEMGRAAKLTGTTLEAFTNASFKLGANLAEGTNKVHAAVNNLGLSYQALQQMSPDAQFRAIAEALGQIENIQERNRIGLALFGRQFKEIAPAIEQGYGQIADGASKATKEQLEGLDDAADALDDLKNAAMTAAVQGLGNLVIGLREATKNINEFLGITRSLTRGMEGWAAIFEGLGLKKTELPKVFKEMAVQAGNLPAPLQAATMSAEEFARVDAQLTAQGEESIRINKERQAAIEAFAESLKKLGGRDAIEGAREVVKQLGALGGPLKVLPDQLEQMAERLRDGAQAALLFGDADLANQYTQLANTLSPVIQFQQRFNVTIGEYVTNAPKAVDWTEELNEQLHRLGGTAIEIGPVLENLFDFKSFMNQSMFAGFKGTVLENLPSDTQWAGAWGRMKDGLKIALAEIPGTLARAFEGGGSIWGAVKSIGSQIGALIGASFGSSETGKAIGAAIGSLVGPVMQGFKKLFGIGINEEIKKFNKEIDKVRENLLKQFGSMERIRRLGLAVGIDLAAAWHHQGDAGLKAFRELAEEFEKRVNDMEDDLEGFRDDLVDAIDEAREMGYVFDQAGNLVEVRFQEMQEAANEFGVDLNALGPAFQAARIAADAKKIINAFELLAKGGTDAGTILFGMRDEISKLVQESLKFGTTIPENMRPWIEELIRAGFLLDENGDAITDIGRIQFGPAIETQFEQISRRIGDLIAKIEELVNVLLNEFKPAIDDATKPVPAPWEHWTDPPNVTMPVFEGIPEFATGTLGRLGSWFGNFPETGAAAMLHGMEAVVTPQQAPAFAMDVLRANAGFNTDSPSQSRTNTGTRTVVHSQIENRILLDSREMKNWIKEAVTVAIEDNERGFRSRLRDGLGVT